MKFHLPNAKSKQKKAVLIAISRFSKKKAVLDGEIRDFLWRYIQQHRRNLQCHSTIYHRLVLIIQLKKGLNWKAQPNSYLDYHNIIPVAQSNTSQTRYLQHYDNFGNRLQNPFSRGIQIQRLSLCLLNGDVPWMEVSQRRGSCLINPLVFWPRTIDLEISFHRMGWWVIVLFHIYCSCW